MMEGMWRERLEGTVNYRETFLSSFGWLGGENNASESGRETVNGSFCVFCLHLVGYVSTGICFIFLRWYSG